VGRRGSEEGEEAATGLPFKIEAFFGGDLYRGYV
jgi:hypothetical protein